MNYIKSLAVLICLFLGTPSSFAQTTQEEEETISLDSGTINNQFEYVIRKSGNFRGTDGNMYESVRIDMLPTLRSHTLDSLKAVHKDLFDTKKIVSAQAIEIDDLKTNLTNTQNDLTKTNNEKNSMSMFGLHMSKTGYNILMWTIIAALFALLLFFVYKFKNSNTITKDAKRALEEMEEEFEEHRKTALEREQKVRRQLQDELNKQKSTKSNKS